VLLYKYSGKTVFYDHIYFVGVLISLFVGWFFFKFIEKPSLLLIKKVKRSLQDTVIPQAVKGLNQHSAI
jgi:peptidoglycan/LPS O-acetylase OafA/YrhL